MAKLAALVDAPGSTAPGTSVDQPTQGSHRTTSRLTPAIFEEFRPVASIASWFKFYNTERIYTGNETTPFNRASPTY